MSRLLLLNIKLAITNLYKYAMGRKVALPGDAVTEQEAGHTEAEVTTSVPGAGLETGGCMTRVTLSTVYFVGQLHEILAHIEDLEAINSWMARADLAQAYHEPQRSTSDI